VGWDCMMGWFSEKRKELESENRTGLQGLMGQNAFGLAREK
jgi:hypothetical protein